MTVSTQPRPTGHPGYSETLPRKPQSADRARSLVRTALGVWGLRRAVDDCALIVTELVTNAVKHARGPSLRVTVARRGRFVRVAVTDGSRTLPRLRHPSGAEADGRGLMLVDALADEWGADLKSWGKSVWANLDIESSA
ncbi:ATP-binding protein [Streptomyces sp. NPDC050560]|uniref:ATP-binding protein n=1 Tax=Streptomyces sp. NPDC050560 TaxID=3365630 RepID=UPI00379F072C